MQSLRFIKSKIYIYIHKSHFGKMGDITTCVAFNKSTSSKNERMTICTEWLEKCMKIVILRPNKVPVIGQVSRYLNKPSVWSILFTSLELYIVDSSDKYNGRCRQRRRTWIDLRKNPRSTSTSICKRRGTSCRERTRTPSSF